MNRPRNRQPRPPRTSTPNAGSSARLPRCAPRNNVNVPTVNQVVPGAGVSIVLKEDQPTGREVQGIVQDLLTRGNHPRGIKVRLQDGRIGRVQRLCTGIGTNMPSASSTPIVSQIKSSNRYGMVTDVRNDDNFPSEPPSRSLADFFPVEPISVATPHEPEDAQIAVCPICGRFEGDEIAVSRHVEEHLT